MEQPTTAVSLDWFGPLNAGLNRLIEHATSLLLGLFTVEAVWLVVAVLVSTHLFKVVARKYVRRAILDRTELYLINVGSGLGLAAALWPEAHAVPWWIAGPCWGTGAHWIFRLVRIGLAWQWPRLYALMNFDRRRTRQKRPPSRERRQR